MVTIPKMSAEQARETIREAVRTALRGDETIMAVEFLDTTDRPDYWENRYYVAWISPSRAPQATSGTHMVCINSRGETALFHGHYDLRPEQAISDARERAGRA